MVKKKIVDFHVYKWLREPNYPVNRAIGISNPVEDTYLRNKILSVRYNYKMKTLVEYLLLTWNGNRPNDLPTQRDAKYTKALFKLLEYNEELEKFSRKEIYRTPKIIE